jgi:uncharacterized protein YndB with AHSA1/START domain
MAKLRKVHAEGDTSASPAAVYALLRDGATWPDWTDISTFALEREGADAPEGLGAIRVWTSKGKTLREEIVELVPDRRFSYTLLSGLALRGYRADVDLAPTASGGCHITWRSTFTPKVPGTGRAYEKALQQATEGFVTGLAAHALIAAR